MPPPGAGARPPPAPPSRRVASTSLRPPAFLVRPERVIVGTGAVLESHWVLVAGGRVEQVAPPGAFEGWTGPVVEGAGASLLPGLIDCHVHILYGAEPNPGVAIDGMDPGAITVRGVLNARRTLEGGITAVRDCGGQDYLELAIRDACNRGDLPGPTMRAAGRMICMTGGHGNRAGRVADGVDEVVKAVREQIHAGADLVKLMATGGVMTPGVDPEDAHYTAEEIGAGIAEAHRFHRRSASHAQGSEGILNAVRGGIDSIEHGIFMNEDCIREMVERGTWLVPTLSAIHNILGAADRGIPEYVLEKSRRVEEAHRRSVSLFYGAGGRIAMGTDAGTPFNHHGANARELAFMVEVGVSPGDAIRFATASAAELMGLADAGRVAAGARADLLLVDGNPLEDIGRAAERRHHRLVLKGGVPAGGSAVARDPLFRDNTGGPALAAG